MKKVIKYTLIFLLVSVVILSFSFFIAGNTNIFDWSSFHRFMIILFIVATFCVIVIVDNC